jgi:hypothetical protein
MGGARRSNRMIDVIGTPERDLRCQRVKRGINNIQQCTRFYACIPDTKPLRGRKER